MRRVHLMCVTLLGILALCPASGRAAGQARKAASAPAATVVWEIDEMRLPKCAVALKGAVGKMPGVVRLGSSVKYRLLEVAYDPRRIDLQRLARAITATHSPIPFTKFEPSLMLLVFGVGGDPDAARLSAALRQVNGVKATDLVEGYGVAYVSLTGQGAMSLAALSAAAKKAGFRVTSPALPLACKLAGGSPAAPLGEGEPHADCQH